MIDALTVAGHVGSPAALSEEVPFRRKFSMVYDTLRHAMIDLEALLHTLLAFQPGDSETIAGYEVYGLDATKAERPDAATLPERISRKQLTPGQVQRAALRFLLQLGTPAKAPKVAGKGKGRAKGYHPTPRVRYPVVKKAKTGHKQAVSGP